MQRDRGPGVACIHSLTLDLLKVRPCNLPAVPYLFPPRNLLTRPRCGLSSWPKKNLPIVPDQFKAVSWRASITANIVAACH